MTGLIPLDPTRLSQVDALRGLAALAVVLYHFTTRFVELYQPGYAPIFSAKHGHFGVNLFFIVSGFVIFMTLQRTTSPMDFVVSRFSRLFPSYWIAIVLTFLVTHGFGLPGKLVSPETALANFFMIHGLFGVQHVDSVYWTLEVEMLFYAGMLMLFIFGWLRHIQWALLVLLSARLIYWVAAQAYEVDLSWTVFKLLNLQFIAWFALGIFVYQARQMNSGPRLGPLITGSVSIITLSITDSPAIGVLAITFAGAVYLASIGALRLLNGKFFLWLGSISYPLYLLHEYIGWSIQLMLLNKGIGFEASVLATLTILLFGATAVTHWVEQPSLRGIRQWYRMRSASRPA